MDLVNLFMVAGIDQVGRHCPLSAWNQGTRIQVQPAAVKRKCAYRGLDIDHAKAPTEDGLPSSKNIKRGTDAGRKVCPVGLVRFTDAVSNLLHSLGWNIVR